MKLLKIIKILASTKDEQINYLIDLGTYPSTDELALDFDYAYVFYLRNINHKCDDLINQIIFKKLNDINKIFGEMSNLPNDSFWEVISLDLNDWSKIREYASELLILMKDI
ncbi:hypothetical protein HNP99_000095 [Flavobacterium sp. 28A]|uniref:hypothetical protein n=1 Tax=Flavobacterium sp. 28A TaxID=2735895 RepID=UPI00156DBA2E|nr:hypothetical protein [Flavobacterium sp. 28A]NRT13770.1 hypothetical protein [Flavobacterium sp. 28A]